MVKVIGIVLLGLVINAQAQPNEGSVTVREGFLKGEELTRMSNGDKASYVMGFIDALLVSPLIGAPENKVDWLGRCVAGMSNKRAVTILDKYVHDHPTEKSQSSNILFFYALSETCPHS